MATPAQVIVLGNSQPYLEAKLEVLRHFWEVETVAVDLGEMTGFAADLLVVCDTIPEPQRQDWVDRARITRPNMLIVRLNGFDSGPLGGADATVDETHGPGGLVSTIYELLTERGLGSRPWPAAPDGGWVQ